MPWGELPEVSREEIADRLVRATSALEGAMATLRDLGNAEGDSSLGHQVAIWRAKAASEGERADAMGTRCALAERALRGLLAGKRSPSDIKAWQAAAKDPA